MMLLDYYGLKEQPFGVTPDPRYLFFCEGHREALASIYYAIEERRGFSALVAQPGMGKTTLLFRLLESLQESARTAFLFQVGQDSRDFLDSLVRDLGIKAKSTDLPALHEALNTMLVKEMEENRRVVVVLDEAQNLTEEMLEQVRLLSNFETPAAKMMHIVLAGQPGLEEKLGSPTLTQLRQRVGAIAHLSPLTLKEIREYVEHRLKTADYRGGTELFTPGALEAVATLSEGIPRNVNNICFQSLALAYVYETPQIDTEIVREVARDLELRKQVHVRQKSDRPVANRGAGESQVREPRAPRSFTAQAATWPSFPAAAQAVDLGYYGMPHAEGQRTTGSRLGIFAFLLVFLPLLTFAVLSKSGVVDANALLDRFMNSGTHSNAPSTEASAPTVTQPKSSVENQPRKVDGTNESSQALSSPASSNPTANPITDGNRAAAGSISDKQDTGGPVLIQLTRKQTVSDLANEYFGTSDKTTVRLILSQNPKLRRASQVLPVGTQLVLPPKSTVRQQSSQSSAERADQQQKPEARPTVPTARKFGRVQVPRDETLFQFALEELGKGDWTTVRQIRAANPQIKDPYQILKKGQWVILPEEIAQH